MRKAETEGKIKGAARFGLRSQSARGLAAAPCLRSPVPRRHATPQRAGFWRVPRPIHHAMLHRSLCHGFA